MSHRSLTRIVLFFAVVSASPVFAQDSGIWERNTLSNPLVTAMASREQVRFSALALAQRMRLEVLSQSGDLLYDSDFRPGNLLEWPVQNQQGLPLPDGLYGCLVTVEDLYGQVSQRHGIFRVADGAASFQRAVKQAKVIDRKEAEIAALNARLSAVEQMMKGLTKRQGELRKQK